MLRHCKQELPHVLVEINIIIITYVYIYIHTHTLKLHIFETHISLAAIIAAFYLLNFTRILTSNTNLNIVKTPRKLGNPPSTKIMNVVLSVDGLQL